MYAFDYRRPHSLNEADLAFKAMPGAKLLAGGQTLIPTMKNRLAQPGEPDRPRRASRTCARSRVIGHRA